MADLQDDGFDEAFKGFGDDPAQVTPPDDDKVTPPAEPPKTATNDENKEAPDADKDKPVDKPDGATELSEEEHTPGDSDKPADPNEKPSEGEAAEQPKKDDEPEAPKPLTEDGVRNIIKDIRNEERNSGKEIEQATQEVIEAYYPDGLSDVLIDETTGKELHTPQDVVDVTDGQMSIEEATRWLLNKQFELKQEVDKIKSDARKVAENTLKFKRDSVDVLTRYEPVFKAYPHLQKKVWDQYSKLVKADEKRDVILSAPDMVDFYDTVLEPYRLAVEYASGQPGTNPTPDKTPEPPKPTTDDRLDEPGDGEPTEVNDPNDFTQQVTKELAL